MVFCCTNRARPSGFSAGSMSTSDFRENQVDGGVSLRREQVVCLGHGGAVGADLVSMHAVHEGRHDRQPTDELGCLGLRETFGVGESSQVGLDLVEPRYAFRRADHHDDQRAALPALRVLNQTRALRRHRGERLHIENDLVGWGDLLPKVVTDHFLERRNARIVARTDNQFLGGGERRFAGLR